MVATPEDSRYVPLTQQPFCCVPTCVQMVMYKNKIPLLPAEEIGYHLGLIVNPDSAHLFHNVRTSDTPPPAGYGTRIYDPEFAPDIALGTLGIPLSLSVKPISEISSAEKLLEQLKEAEAQDGDILLCFNQGVLVDDPSRDWGHVCVFDRIIDGGIRIIDPSPNHPKWRIVEASKMLNAMQKHGAQKSAGLWLLSKK